MKRTIKKMYSVIDMDTQTTFKYFATDAEEAIKNHLNYMNMITKLDSKAIIKKLEYGYSLTHNNNDYYCKF